MRLLTVRTEAHDGVTIVRLSHGKVNAFDLEMVRDLTAVLEAEQRSGSGAVVLTADGSVFSAGVDLHRVTREGRGYVSQFLPLLTEVFQVAFGFTKPLIAAINGHAVAGGCILACAADYRLMARGNGRIGTPELAVGVPFPMVAIEILRVALPSHRLQALVYGGLTCTPEEALANGLVDEVVPSEELLERSLAFAARLGSLPRAAFGLSKRLLRQPGLERLAASGGSIDQDVLEAWMSEPVLQAIDDYVDRTLTKSPKVR